MPPTRHARHLAARSATLLTGASAVVLFALASYHAATTPEVKLPGLFVMTVAMATALELFPAVLSSRLRRSHRRDPQAETCSTAFMVALLFIWGMWPATLVGVVFALVAHRREGPIRALLEAGQVAVSVSAAYLVIVLMHHPVSLAHPLMLMDYTDLLWVPVAWFGYVVTNTLVAAVSRLDRRPISATIRRAVRDYGVMTLAIMLLAPLVIVVGRVAWPLLPLLVVPVLLLYSTSSLAAAREHAASHDALTGLLNRDGFYAALEQALATFRQGGVPFAVMLTDLDDFKRVNDTLGHAAGDRYLVEIGRRLAAHRVRPGDVVARMGGDEFAVIAPGMDEGVCRTVAARLREMPEPPVELDGIALDVTGSVGIAVCPSHGEDVLDLLRRADVALYQAKANRTVVEIYTVEHDPNTTDRLGMLGDLRRALRGDEIHLVYQPKVDANRRPVGVEALVRWRHPRRGPVAPDQFIPIAEGTDVMPMLTRRVVDLALAQAAAWHAEGLRIPVAVNIAPADLETDGFVDFLEDVTRPCADVRDLLHIEITERMVTHEAGRAAGNIDRMHALGLRLSLDDFGTGYSSMQRLSTLRVDEIKIDRSFIEPISVCARSVGIVRGMIDLAHSLELSVVAEGVETPEQFDTLTRLGCDVIQGYGVARPLDADAAGSWLRSQQLLTGTKA